MRYFIPKLILLSALLAFWNTSSAQCSYSGTLIDGSSVGGCGWLIVDEAGTVFQPVFVPGAPEDGQLVTFDYEPDTSATCFLAESIQLTCFEVEGGMGSICQADFSYSFFGSPPVVMFEPQLLLPGIVDYSWSFGDGATSTDATPTHSYATADTFEVCLTVSYNGCLETSCMLIPFSEPSIECNYALSLSFDGEVITGEIYNTTDYGPYHPDVVEWTDPQSGDIIGSGPYLDYEVNDPNYYGMICASYSAIMPGGDTCEATICQTVSPINSCVDPDMIDLAITCPAIYMPVCGCDGQTYNNACEAQYWYGVTEWTTGPCQGDTSSCMAFFHVEALDSASFLFLNTSVGDFTQQSWTIDGNAAGDETNLQHSFTEQGIYTVCLTVENDLTGCSSTYCQEVYAGNPDDMCEYTDCVWPGDANGDGMANVYDLLYVGVGYGSFGLQRPDAHLDWVGQFGPDWDVHTSDGVDFKHLDCNGDGVILADDVEAISLNYQPAFDVSFATTNGAPLVYLDFDQDTIEIDPSSPEFVTITAGLMVGSTDNEMENLHGLATQLYYPQQDIVLPNSADVLYEYNSFMGTTNQTFWEYQDFYNFKRLDLGCSRKGGSEVQGHGRVATVEFIIVSDIIGGRSENVIDFDVFMEGIKVVDGNGELLAFDAPTGPATLTIINNFTTGTEEVLTLENQVHIFPNPAREQVFVRSETLELQRVSLYNALGQLIQVDDLNAGLNTLDLQSIPAGVYMLEIESEEGRVTKRLIVE